MREDLRIGEVAHRLDRDKETIREWVRRGLLKAHLSPTGQLLFDETDVEAVRRGERPPNPTQAKSEPSAPELPQDRPRIPKWKELPPWEAEVESARASLTLDELQAEREARAEEREMDQQRRLLAEQQSARDEAQRQRLNRVKNRAVQLVWGPSKWRPQVIEGIERFATPERVPDWMPEWQQLDIICTYGWSIVHELQAEEDRQEKAERAKEQEQANAERERANAERAKEQERVNAERAKQQERLNAARAEDRKRTQKLADDFAAAMRPGPKPKTVSEALRRRGIVDS